jgi:hypothetical protein
MMIAKIAERRKGVPKFKTPNWKRGMGKEY